MEYSSEENNNTVVEDNAKMKVSGVVNKAKTLSKPLKDKNNVEFFEVILPDTFKNAIEKAKNENTDIKLLVNHDPERILARTGNDSLVLEELEGKTVFSAELPQTTLGKDIYEIINKGLSFGMSFGFSVESTGEKWTHENGTYKREISEMLVSEISILTIEPAYEDTEIKAEQRALTIPKNLTTKDVQKPMEKLQIKNPEESLNTIIKEERALQTTAQGAAVIPDNVADELIKRIEDVSPVFEMARKFPSVAGTLKVARETEATANAGFVGEGSDVADLGLNLDMVQLTQKRVGGYVTLSQQLINDGAINMDEYVPDMLSRQVGKAIERSILVGKGGTEFSGIVNDKDVQAIEVAVVTIDSLMELYLSVKPQFLQGAVFIMNEDTFKAVAKLKDGSNQPYLQNGVVNGVITRTLFGLPVHTTEALPSTQPIVFGNVENAISILIKKEVGLQQIVDSALAIKGAKVYVLDAYMDAAVVNPQAVATMKVTVA